MRWIWRSALCLALLIAAGAARAQTQPCAQSIAPKIVAGTLYTVSTTDRCGWIILTSTFGVTVQLPAPGLIFAPGFELTLLPLNGATITFTNLPDTGGLTHLVNGLSTLTLAEGRGALLKIQQDTNWYALPTGAGATGAINISFTSGLGSTPNPITGTGTAFLAPIAGNQVLGNIQPMAAQPVGLTQTELTALINVFSSSLSGAVPAPGASDPNFFLSEAGWAQPTISNLADIPARSVLGNTLNTTGPITAGFSLSGDQNKVVTLAGSTSNGDCAQFDVNGNLASAGAACSSGGGGGSVVSVGLSVPASSIFGVTGSPITTSGTLGLTTSGISGGVPFFSSTSQLASSGLLTAGKPVIGGGAGSAPVVGTTSGNTTEFATVTGSLTSGDFASWDASGNAIDSGVTTGTSGHTLPFLDGANTWSGAQRGAPVNVAISTSTFTPNFNTGQNFEIDLTSACPCTVANPSTTLVAGQAGMIEIHQDSSGSRTIGTWGADYLYAGGTSSITLSTAANAVDYLAYYVDAAGTGIVLGSIILAASH